VLKPTDAIADTPAKSLMAHVCDVSVLHDWEKVASTCKIPYLLD
jgi:hypothetical protein